MTTDRAGYTSRGIDARDRCRACRFPLPQEARGRCPECGLEFDKADERSFLSEADLAHRRQLRWRLAFAIALAGLAGATCLGGFLLYLHWKAQDMSW